MRTKNKAPAARPIFDIDRKVEVTGTTAIPAQAIWDMHQSVKYAMAVLLEVELSTSDNAGRARLAAQQMAHDWSILVLKAREGVFDQ